MGRTIGASRGDAFKPKTREPALLTRYLGRRLLGRRQDEAVQRHGQARLSSRL